MMLNTVQWLSYIFELIFLALFLTFILVCIIRLVRSRSVYDADQDELLIEFRCLTVTKKHWFGQTSIELKPGTYAVGTSLFSELRIKDTGEHFAGMLEVFESGECHLYINSGAIEVADELYDESISGYITLNPGDVFSIGRQTCMINRLAQETPILDE